MTNLPVSGDTHDQERRSVLAFSNLVPADLFLIREENGGDYGVDRILELRFSGKAITNFRAHSQLKSVLNGHRNTDGSLSFPVPIKTLNYLLNQPNSLFFVYVENENVFHWAWATDIAKAADHEGIDIKTTSQNTFSYRFRSVLDRSAFENIHSTLFKLGTAFRNLTEHISSSLPDSTVTTSLDLSTGKLRTTDETIKLIKQYGISLANTGHYYTIDRMLLEISASAKSDPELGVIVSYIKLHKGEYADAFSWLPRGKKLENLSTDMRATANFIHLSLNYLLGITDQDYYKQKVNDLENDTQNSILGLQLRLERQREAFFWIDKTDQEKYEAAESSLRDTIASLKKLNENSEVLKSKLNLIEWEIQGNKLLTGLSHSFALVSVREKLGFPIPNEERVRMAREHIEAQTKWMKRFFELDKAGWPSVSFQATAKLSLASLQMQFMAHFRALILDADDSSKTVLQKMKQDLEASINNLEAEGFLHEVLRGKLLLAECVLGLGNSEEAMKIASETKEQAEMYEVTDMTKSLSNFLEGNALFNLRERIVEKGTITEYLAGMKDDDVQVLLRQIFDFMGLPHDRKEYVEREITWLKADAAENLSWCKYLQVLQDLSHTRSMQTLYSTDPDRKYSCSLLGFRSNESGKDREYLLSEFKRLRCSSCEKRKPGINQ
ncbi:DUF4365 domain-containing protein [Paenibacillus sp. GCM10012303]|uniref:DUF4365 domain-containing protein n=1 Tax=Paenibacillus sp. GCM10012303 TaxID=3317340 RepID=UPI003621D818